MIRAFNRIDKEKLIELLWLNTPEFFDVIEEKDFIDYLEHYAQHYFVVEENGKIIGSGGINYFAADNLARISWDIIHPDFQGRGIGKKLTIYRINEIKKNPAMDLIVVRTTQLVYKFYQKMGFELEKVEKDFWAKGFDLYQMKMSINRVCL